MSQPFFLSGNCLFSFWFVFFMLLLKFLRLKTNKHVMLFHISEKNSENVN